jgi:hypothetical protein
VSLDAGELTASMVTAALAVLRKKTPAIRTYAEGEFRKIAQAIVTIEALAADGRITHDEAVLHLQMQRGASAAVLMTVKGMGLLDAEAAINAALDAVRTSVDAALPFKLL